MSQKKIELEAAEARREYQREWRRRNPDRVKRYNADFWKRKAAQRLAEKEAKGDV